MTSRLTPTLVALALVASALSGCTPPPEPEPIPGPPFATEEEAFAAAEETYRAYVDALNQVDLSDPDTFEPVFALTTGDMHDAERRSLSEAHASGLQLVGSASVEQVLLDGVDLSHPGVEVAFFVCVDSSGTDILNANGESLVHESRPDRQSLRVVVTKPDGRSMGVSEIAPSGGGLVCD